MLNWVFFFYGGTFVHKVTAATCWWTVNDRKLCTESFFFKNTNTIPGYVFFSIVFAFCMNQTVSLGSPYPLIFLQNVHVGACSDAALEPSRLNVAPVPVRNEPTQNQS